jgi:hypothetical protein
MLSQKNSGHHEMKLAFKSVSYRLIISVLSSALYPVLTSCHAYGLTLIFGCAAMKTLHVMTAVKDKKNTKCNRQRQCCRFLRLHSVSGRWRKCDYGILMEWHWEGKMGGENFVPMSRCSPQIPHGMPWDRSRSSAVRGQQLAIRAMAWNKVISLRYLKWIWMQPLFTLFNKTMLI